MRIPVITPALLKAQTRRQKYLKSLPRDFYQTTAYRMADGADKGEGVGAVADELQRLSAPLSAALDEINGKATSFTVTSPTTVRAIADSSEAKLAASGVPLALRPGTVATYTPAGPTASAYKHAAVSTRIVLERGTDGRWFLTAVERIEVYPKQTERHTLVVSEEAAAAIKAHAMAGYQVKSA